MEIYMDDLTHEFPYELGNDFKYIETIDHGAFGTVIHVIEISTNRDMAIKVINKTSSHLSYIEKVKEEISILKQLSHENIVKFFGFFETLNQLLIKMEYIKHGTLKKYMKNHKKISEIEASLILSQIFSAVVYLHSKQICHRDIKPENIMLSRENDLSSIKIIDFGLSAQHFYKLMNNDYCGTYIYMAPEQIEKKLYFLSVDIWSIGILMFMLLNYGKHPFYIKGELKKDFDKKIQNCKITFYNKVSPMAKHLIFKLLEPNPSWRYTASQALKHPWITRNKNDEVPLTFNEILNKTNMQKVGRGILGSLIFINFITKKKKFFIDKKYINACSYYDERAKIKNKRKIDKCLDILSTSDEDNSDNELQNDKIILVKRNVSEKNKNILINSIQNSFAISASSIIHKKIKKNNVNFVKSIKKEKDKEKDNIKKLYKTDQKKQQFNFKKMDYQLNLFSTRKRADSLSKNNNISNNNNTYRDNFIKININSKNNNRKEIVKRNPQKKTNKENTKELNYSKSLRMVNNSHRTKLINNDYFEEKKLYKKELPDINSIIKKNETIYKNDLENYSMLPLILPNINSFQKEKNNMKTCIKKLLITNKLKRIKNS